MINYSKGIGKLVIYKDNGKIIEKLQEHKNIVTVGMGISIASLMLNSPKSIIDNFSPNHCQLGTGVVDYLSISSDSQQQRQFYSLASPLSKDSYGNGLSRKIVTKKQITSISDYSSNAATSVTTTSAAFIQLYKSSITIKKENSFVVNIKIDRNMANGSAIREIGLFSGDSASEKSNRLLLSCYKQFNPINKTSDFSLIFEWTIQIVDRQNSVVWDPFSTNQQEPPRRGRGEEEIPSFFYPFSEGGTLWQVPVGLPIEIATATQNPTNSIRPGSFGFVDPAAAAASGFTIDSITGDVSGDPPSMNAIGTLQISGAPINRQFPDAVIATIPFEISISKSTGGGETYLGQLSWQVPEGASLNSSAVIRCVVPTSSGDFDSNIWGNYTNWLLSGIEGGKATSAFSATGIVAQIHPVQRNASGGYETVEVIFPTTVTKNSGQYQYYDLFTTSASVPGNNPTIEASGFIHAKVKDVSGNIYGITPNQFASGYLSTSSILKTGPYLTTYKFTYRMRPEFTVDPNNIEHKPFALTVYQYLTIKKYDPLIKVDFRFSNGLYMLQGWGGGPNDGVGAVYKNTGLQQEYQILGNFYYSDLWIEHDQNLSAICNIERYSVVEDPIVNPSTNRRKVSVVWPYPASGDTGWNNRLSTEENVTDKCHVFPKTKHFSRRFCLAPSGTSLSKTYIRQMANYGDIGFPVRGRSWFNIPKWGLVGDLAPYLGGLMQIPTNGLAYYETQNFTRRAPTEEWRLPGSDLKSCFAYLYKRKFSDLERVSSQLNWNGTNIPEAPNGNVGSLTEEEISIDGVDNTKIVNSLIKTINENDPQLSNFGYITKCPFNTANGRSPNTGSLQYITPFIGFTLTNEELNYLGLKAEYADQRINWVNDVSGNPLDISSVMNKYSFTSATAPANTNIFEYAYPGYYGAFVSQNNINKAENFFPKLCFATKSNSKVCEPDESLTAVPQLTANPYKSSVLSRVGTTGPFTQTNKCPYAYKVLNFANDLNLGASPISEYSWGISTRMPGGAHFSRLYMGLAPLVQLTNDPLFKDDYEMLASIACHMHPPYPDNVVMQSLNLQTGAATPSYFTDFTGYKFLKEVSSITTSGQGFTLETLRATVNPIAAASFYFGIASDYWRSRHLPYFEYIGSALHSSWIRENGFLEANYLDGTGDPAMGGFIQTVLYGHNLSSVPSDPKKTFYMNRPGANAPSPYTSNTLTSPYSAEVLNNNKGNYFDTSNLGTQVFHSSYQTMAFALLAKNVMRYRNNNLYESLTSALEIQASTMVFNAFQFVSGSVQSSDIAVVIKDRFNETGNTSVYDLFRLGNSPFENAITTLTKTGTVFSGTINVPELGLVNLATANSISVLRAIATVQNNQLLGYMSPLDTTKLFGGFPNVLATCSDSLKASKTVYGRGTRRPVGSSIPKKGFTGSDLATSSLQGDKTRIEDCSVYFSIGLMASSNWELSSLDASNTVILKSGYFRNNYYDCYQQPTPLSSLEIQPNKIDYLNASINHHLNSMIRGRVHDSAPLLAYLRYTRDNNGQPV